MKKWIEASAPGRLDFMGGIADYSGALVLQLPIRERVHVRLRLRDDSVCTFVSRLADGNVLKATLNCSDFLLNNNVDYTFARQQFRTHEKIAWTAYILGCAMVLQKEKDIAFRGADIIVESEVPVGKGVASSAALEIATMRALEQAFGFAMTASERASLAQKSENLIVGAPCGLMDQLTSSCGEEGKLLPIRCQPDTVCRPLHISDGLMIAGIDSGTRHSIGGSSYTNVRCAAFMGYSIIAQAAGASPSDLNNARREGDWSNLPFKGYLCNIPVSVFESEFASLLPEAMTGVEFISEFGLTTDHVTAVDPEVTYAIRACTVHPVHEQQRVEQVSDMLSALNVGARIDREQLCKRIGQLMLESHKSYSRCGLGSTRTDELVNAALACEGIYGAKITGGGSGGTVCVFAEAGQGMETVRYLHRRFCEDWGEELTLFI